MSRLHHRPRTARGFTLIEVMIVVAIIAIIAAFALPNYREHVAKSRRADGKALLLEAAQWMERQYTVSRNYTRTGGGNTIDTAAVNAAPLAASASASKYYTLSFADESLDVNRYSLVLAPAGTMENDKCGSFTLDQAGTRGVTGGTATATECWGR